MPLLVAYALIRGYSAGYALEIAAVVGGLAAIARLSRDRRTAMVAASVGLLSCSAILVDISGGVIEMHFHFFVVVAVVALYQDWLPFFTAILFVFLHHGVFGALNPHTVYDNSAAWRKPWLWAAIHAGFISALSVVCLLTWRLNEIALEDREAAEENLRQEGRLTASLNDVARTLAADLDPDRVVQAVTDAATTLTHAAFGAFFYNVVDEAGQSYMLYTLSGASREAFDFGLPRNTEVFRPTFEGHGPVRLDDVTVDRRYGLMAPHYGMPKGHLPVRSYLAVPVRSRTGLVLGGLFFGHPEAGRFTEIDERIALGVAAHAAVALDNAQLFRSSELARQRLAIVSEATELLTSSQDPDEALQRVARLVVPAIADACIIELDPETSSGADPARAPSRIRVRGHGRGHGGRLQSGSQGARRRPGRSLDEAYGQFYCRGPDRSRQRARHARTVVSAGRAAADRA